jgi:K+-transporting ATPase c subunit
MRREAVTALRMTLVTFVLTGLAYPLARYSVTAPSDADDTERAYFAIAPER